MTIRSLLFTLCISLSFAHNSRSEIISSEFATRVNYAVAGLCLTGIGAGITYGSYKLLNIADKWWGKAHNATINSYIDHKRQQFEKSAAKALVNTSIVGCITGGIITLKGLLDTLQAPTVYIPRTVVITFP